MREKLIANLNAFFKHQNDDITLLASRKDILPIGGMTALINSLKEEQKSPKIVARNLEDVIVQLSLKEELSPRETELKAMLKGVQDNPELVIKNNFRP